MPARPSRRTVVAAALALPVAAGCTLSGPAPERAPVRRSTKVEPDVALLDEVVASTEAIVALYEGVLQRHRGLRTGLRPLLDAHRAHASALGDAAPSDGSTRRRRGRRRNRDAARGDVPAAAGQALRRLTAAERDASTELLGASRRAASGTFARMLASMSASSAQAVRVLGEVDGR